jgi:hypothetical protein
MDRYIRYDWEYQLAICVSCETGLPYPLVTARFTGETEINVWGRGPVSHHGKKIHQ